jgi:hypothetical protein
MDEPLAMDAPDTLMVNSTGVAGLGITSFAGCHRKVGNSGSLEGKELLENAEKM